MTHAHRFSVLLGAALVIGLGVIAGDSSLSYASASNVLNVAVRDCSLHCDHCNAQHTEHLTHLGGETNGDGQLHAACFPGTCSVHDCGSDDENSTTAAAAAESNDKFVLAWAAFRDAPSNDLVRIVNEHPRFFRVNMGRKALQFLNCAGEVFANIPMDGGVWDRLVSESSQSLVQN